MWASLTHYELLWALAVALWIYSYIPYIRDILKGTTKPHAFSRFIRSLMTWIAFAAQVTDNGGAWTRSMWLTTVACFVIFLFWLKYWKSTIASIDYLFLFISLLSLVVWYITNTPLRSVVIITIADAFAFLPTFRKSRYKPYEETLITYVLSWIKMWLSVIALENFSIINALYPLSLVVMNGLFMMMLVYRRRKINKITVS